VGWKRQGRLPEVVRTQDWLRGVVRGRILTVNQGSTARGREHGLLEDSIEPTLLSCSICQVELPCPTPQDCRKVPGAVSASEWQRRPPLQCYSGQGCGSSLWWTGPPRSLV